MSARLDFSLLKASILRVLGVLLVNIKMNKDKAAVFLALKDFSLVSKMPQFALRVLQVTQECKAYQAGKMLVTAAYSVRLVSLLKRLQHYLQMAAHHVLLATCSMMA